MIRDSVRDYTEREFPRQLSSLTPATTPSGGGTEPEATPAYVGLHEILTEAAAGKATLQTQDEVTGFVDELGTRLRAIVAEGKGITL